MNTLYLVVAFVYGIIVGSFLNVVILRLPKGEKLTGRSHCFSCGHILGPWELVPLFSYIFLRGRCKKCKKKFSPRYFIIEFITGLFFAFTFLFVRPSDASGFILFFRDIFLISVFLVIFVIDLENYLILDVIVFPSILVAVLLALALGMSGGQGLLGVITHIGLSLLWALAAAFPFFLIWYFSKGKWMGFGDVKLALLLGAVFSGPVVFVCLMLAIFGGGIISVFLLIAAGKNLKSQIPFGTFLSLSAAFCLFYGPAVLKWYLAFLGL